MIVTVKNRNIKYAFSFGNITQLCGSNIPIKTFIIDSLCKHFSSEKFKEYEETLIDNIEMEGEVPGRKQWEIYRVNSIETIVNCIQMNKSSILGKCLKECVAEFDCQNDLLQIDEILLKIFDNLNKRLLPDLPIELQYTQEDLFGMLQQTSVRTTDGKDIHELGIEQLLEVFVEIIDKQQEVLPEKRLYIFEDLDHLVDKKMYKKFVRKCEMLTRESNIWFLFSTSLDGYVCLLDDYFEYINVIGDDIYSLPEFERVMTFIKEYYPVERAWDTDEVKDSLTRIIQKVSHRDVLLQPEELIFLKLINESNDIKDCWKNEPKAAEIKCLEAPSVL